jgi:conjugative relaxase-like TrwC/TraI family protein
MLTIGKIGGDRKQQLYYDSQVAKGAEDYYAGKGEAPGSWHGEAAAGLGLSGPPSADQLLRMFAGRHPETGEQLARRPKEGSKRAVIAGFDLTFKAPKSVSVLFAANDELADRMTRAHETAVTKALEYMQTHAMRVRRGHNGTQAERDAKLERGWQSAESLKPEGVLMARYRHRVSRAMDPHLHTHVVIPNMAKGPDGRWTALEHPPLYEYAKSGGAVYQAFVRHEVLSMLPWAKWMTPENGVAELVEEQIPGELRKAMSKRTQQINERERELALAGFDSSPKLRDLAGLETRASKPESGLDEAEWLQRVRAEMAEHGLDQNAIEALMELADAPDIAAVDERILADQLFGRQGLTKLTNTFHRRDLVFAVASAHIAGAETLAEIEAMVDRLLASDQVVKIDHPTKPLYTTVELVECEQQIVNQARDGRGIGFGLVDDRDVIAEIRRSAATGLVLNEGQAAAVRGITHSGNQIDTIEALAGTGKTTTASVLRKIYENAGFEVIGAAPTGRAERELKERAGITNTRTLDSWDYRLARNPDLFFFPELSGRGVGRKPAVLILDEATMAHTRLSAAVMTAAVESGVKVVAIGDSGQLSSVQAGGWLGRLTKQFGSFELDDVRRQINRKERAMLAQVHAGNPGPYIEFKLKRRELQVFDGEHAGLRATQDAVEKLLKARKHPKIGPEGALIISLENERRHLINDIVRETLYANGELGETAEIGGREWAVNDRVILRQNDHEIDVDNGMRGIIKTVSQDGLQIQIDGYDLVTVPAWYVAQHTQYAYAITGHSSQGATVKWATVIGRAGDFSKNWGYTALSRAQYPTRMLVIDEPTPSQQERAETGPLEKPDTDLLRRLEHRLKQRDDEDLAISQIDGAEARRHWEATLSPDAKRRIARTNRARQRQELVDGRERMHEIAARLNDPQHQDDVQLARSLAEVRDRVTLWQQQGGQAEAEGGHLSPTQLEDLSRLLDQENALMEQVAGEPEDMLDLDLALRDELSDLTNLNVVLQEAVEPQWLVAQIGAMPNDEQLRDLWVQTSEKLHEHRFNHGIHRHEDTSLPSMPTSLRTMLRRSREQLGHRARETDLDRGF